MLDFLVNDQPLLLFGALFSMALLLNLAFKRFSLPHILFYLFVGFIGSSFLFPNTINSPEIQSWFHIVEIFALGLIGLQIGTELHYYLMKKEPKIITGLLLANVVGAFLLSYFVIFFFTGNMVLALMLAALATSTAPATTMGVIKKLQAKGKLTTRVQWVLAFDDVVSVAIVEAFLVISIISLGGNPSIGAFVIEFGREIGLAIIIGLVIGLILNAITERMDDNISMMELTFGVTMLAIGLAEFVHTSAITTSMTIGAVVVNTGGDNYKDAHDLLDIIMAPILALFFILIGAKVTMSFFWPLPWLAFAYFAARGIGKVYGTIAGGKILGIEEPMRSGLGYSLVAQGGVVLALASRIAEIFTQLGNPELGIQILNMVIISTILSEFVGAIGTDYAIRKNGDAFQAKIGENQIEQTSTQSKKPKIQDPTPISSD